MYNKQSEDNIRWKRSERWSKQEYKVFKLLVKHYGKDFRSISDEMNKTFFNKSFRPAFIKSAYDAQDPNKAKSQLTVEEAEKLYKFYIHQVKLKNPRIWRTVQTSFQNRSVVLLAKRFYMVIVKLMRRFNFFYGSVSTRYFYHSRVQNFLQSSMNMMFYLGTTDPSIYEQGDELALIIWNACKQLVQLINMCFKQKLIDKDEPQDYIDPKVFNKMPQMSEEEFANIIEPVLLLDTINRITLGMTPYTEIKGKYEDNKQYEEIPPILVEKKHGNNVFFEKDKHNPYVKTKENFHPRLTQYQVKIVKDSPTAKVLLPLYLIMFQHTSS